ncbi:MAG: hypothetical protein EZS28_015934 [Streblomastix strix]|uniref:Uncharacterized protein n=1 Tax=Streblomastix strix TaxID=222440 RepID=A0A5J4W1X9_9EUKA|nr:MAG: hypothetical protein EZS28_015934 [Streblomastix strix]
MIFEEIPIIIQYVNNCMNVEIEMENPLNVNPMKEKEMEKDYWIMNDCYWMEKLSEIINLYEEEDVDVLICELAEDDYVDD